MRITLVISQMLFRNRQNYSGEGNLCYSDCNGKWLINRKLRVTNIFTFLQRYLRKYPFKIITRIHGY